MVDRITRKSETLARFPLSGHVVPEYENELASQLFGKSLKAIIGSFIECSPVGWKCWQ